MKILFISVIKLLLVFDILSGQQINFGFISQNPVQKYPSELYYDSSIEDIDTFGSDYFYTYDNTDPSAKPGFFFNYRYYLSGYRISLGFENIGSKDGIINRTRDYYINGLPAESSYGDRYVLIRKAKEYSLSLFSLSIEKEYMLNDVSSLIGLSGLPDFTNDISLYVGLKAISFNDGEAKGQNTYEFYELEAIDSSTSRGIYTYDYTTEYDEETYGVLNSFKSSSPAILLGISYKFMPKFKIFAEYSTATVKREWDYYDNDDEKKVSTGSGSFSLGITYDFRLSPEEKAAKMEAREAKQKAKREKLKKELENF